MLISTALIILMTIPGLALFYWGGAHQERYMGNFRKFKQSFLQWDIRNKGIVQGLDINLHEEAGYRL